jgi:tetratricopeptide (TPR) repeat protein
MHERALAIREKKLGADHTDVAASLVNLANVNRGLREYEKALVGLQRALAIYERAFGARHPLVATALFNIGWNHEGLGAHAVAVEAHERALDIRENGEVPPADLAESRFSLARALWENGTERARARELAEQARETFATLGAAQRDSLAEVDAWLAAHRVTPRARRRP